MKLKWFIRDEATAMGLASALVSDGTRFQYEFLLGEEFPHYFRLPTGTEVYGYTPDKVL